MVSGVTTFSFHLADGLREAGHDVVTINSTKSGKETVRWSRTDGGARWWHQAPDITVPHDDLATLLDDLDFVLLSDVTASTLPEHGYIDGFARTRTRWATFGHGNAYEKTPEFLELIDKARSFSGIVFACTAPYSYDTHPLFGGMICIPIRRPYVPRLPVGEPLTQMRYAGTIGRFSTGKNLHLMAFSWLHRPEPVDIVLNGATINSMRPCDSYLTFETLAAQDGVHTAVEPETKNKTSEWIVNNYPNTPPSHVHYAGAYTNAVSVARTLRAFLNLTSQTFSAGTEYTTMEAFDAGCMVAVPDGMLDPGSKFGVGWLPRIEVPRGVVKGANETTLLKAIADKTAQMMAVPDPDRTMIAEYNRQVLRTEHSPLSVARVIEGVL